MKISRIDAIGQNGGDGLHYDAINDCEHVWIFYWGSKYRQCHDCKLKESLKDSDNITAYKRNSTI